MKKNLLCFKLFLTLLLLFSLSNISKAQIEDIQVGTKTRKMLVYAPSDIVPNPPLLLSLHGMNQDIAYQQNQTKWETIAAENNFVVVYPAGINNSWDISGTSDTDFILAIIDEMYNRYSIDRDRVYLSGFSMGGMLTYHAANKIADKIAAFAPVSGYLMGGPNTNSSRPIPIIHTHGTADDVVAYTGVATCLNAWIARNGCASVAQVTQPYPADKPSSKGTKYYWGQGIDSVKIVLLSLSGVWHWHSLDPNGVNTSQEIWNFCKDFSLSLGVPKFVNAYVSDNDPKKIQVEFSLPIKESDKYEGFTVKMDGQIAAVNTIVLTDSVHLAINLNENILNSSEIQLSYTDGDVVSKYEKALKNFTDKLVENMLTGSSPRIVKLSTTTNGDTIIASFNKKMTLLSSFESLTLKAEFQGEKNITVEQCSFLKNDSTVLAFTLGEKVYADYSLSLVYSGGNVSSSDGGLLKSNQNFAVTNNSIGLPAKIVSATLEADAMAFALEFSKPINIKTNQITQFAFTVNGAKVDIKEALTINNSVRFILKSNLYFGDLVKVTYNTGNITAVDKGSLDAFTDFVVKNPLAEPTYYPIIGRIEAENYTLQYGIDTETTSDVEGNLNIGWTDAGDWLIYAIENNTDETEFEISFRVAAQAADTKFDYYVDDEKIGQLAVPATGGWQVWKSEIKDIVIPKGKHYLKFVAVTGGFNINYFDIKTSFVSSIKFKASDLSIYSIPSSNQIIIKSPNFEYNKIKIMDSLGRLVLFTGGGNYSEEYCLSVTLDNGIYFVSISNGKISYTKQVEMIK